MREERWIRVLSALAGSEDLPGPRLCTVAARFVSVSGAGVTLMTHSGGPRMTVCSSDRVAGVLEDLQFSLGEGPCIDAYAEDRPVIERDLASATSGRWPGFSAAALEGGAAAVFGFPLRVGRERIGTLNLYRDAPGPLSAEQFADALVVADAVAQEILVLQAAAGPGAVALGLVGEPGLRLVVHQATGMVAVQLGVGVDEALLRIRAKAYSDGISVAAVATSVVERRLRFEIELDPPPARRSA